MRYSIPSTEPVSRLLRRAGGWRGISDWARDRGFRPDTALLVIRRWYGRTDRRPHGGISRQIMAQLEADLAALPAGERAAAKEVA